MLQRDAISSQYYIHSFEQGIVKVLSAGPKKPEQTQEQAYNSYSTTILVSQEALKFEGLAASFKNLECLIFDEVKELETKELEIEILLVGTGPTQKFPPVELLKKTSDYSFSIDFMDTGAACRTFNILANENRRVAALLFPN